jgi:hypothetical protein
MTTNEVVGSSRKSEWSHVVFQYHGRYLYRIAKRYDGFYEAVRYFPDRIVGFVAVGFRTRKDSDRQIDYWVERDEEDE